MTSSTAELVPAEGSWIRTAVRVGGKLNWFAVQTGNHFEAIKNTRQHLCALHGDKRIAPSGGCERWLHGPVLALIEGGA